MAQKERTIRFVVGTRGGLRPSTWRCWTPSGGKSDVYLAPRSLAGAYKISLHESILAGWLDLPGEAQAGDGGTLDGGSRLAAQFSRPRETAPGCLLAFRVLVPASAVSIDSAVESLPGDLIWIPPPPPDRAVEIALIMTAPGAQTDGWPSRRAMSTGLVGGFPLDSGQDLWLVHRQVRSRPSLQRKLRSAASSPDQSTRSHWRTLASLWASTSTGHRPP
jgi:hypothetical protein